MPDPVNVFGPTLSSYSRRQAIEDGVLVDLTKATDTSGRNLCRDAGFTVPVAPGQLAGILEGVYIPSFQMLEKWENEKKAISRIREVKEQIEKTKQMMKEAEREVNYTRLAELQYGEMSRLDGDLKKEEERLAELQKSEKMLKEEVDEEDVAEVVSKWTGIPVSRMLEGEVEKLVHMEERLRQRVGTISEAKLREVERALRISLAL
jgi:DNA polymerase III delta prime subunit